MVEVYTDKLVAEIPSPSTGKIIKINYMPEQACLVGKALCEIEIEELVSSSDNKNKSNKNSNEEKTDLGIDDILLAESDKRNEILDFTSHKTTPAVRHLLKKHNIRPDLIVPTGKDKRILKEDVLRYINNLSHPIPPKHAQVPLNQNNTVTSLSNTTSNLAPPTKQISKAREQLEEDKIVKLTGFKKAMTKTMTQSTLIPSFLYTDEFNVDKLVKLRQEMNKIDGGKIKFTYMPFFIKAVSNALLEFPSLNSNVNPTLGEDGYISEYTLKKDHNISIAIDSPEGLVVPNIKRVQDKSLLQIQQELYELRDKAESRKLSSEDLRDGTFTISNIGNIGGKVLSPVILPPQVCIIGISKIFDSVTVVPRSGEYQDSQAYQLVKKKDLAVVFNKAVNLCISADHRIIDGATVARFSELLKTYVQQPLKIWTTST